MDYESISTPESCYVDFCLLPVSNNSPLMPVWIFMLRWTDIDIEQLGTGSVSVAEDIAEVQKVLKASGLKYTLHSAGTTVGASFCHIFSTICPHLVTANRNND